MRKKVNKYGNRTYTVKELQELLPKLEGDRTAAQALGKKMGMRIYIIDLLRGLLGFTATTPAKIPQTYYAIIRKAGLECNRKRNYWTVFKDKRLIYMHEVQKLSFREIQKQFPERTKSALEQRYEKLKRGAA